MKLALCILALASLVVACGRIESHRSRWKKETFRSPDDRFVAVIEELVEGSDPQSPFEKLVSVSYTNSRGHEVEEKVYFCDRDVSIVVLWTGPESLTIRASGLETQTFSAGPIAITYEDSEKQRIQTAQPGAADNLGYAQRIREGFSFRSS